MVLRLAGRPHLRLNRSMLPCVDLGVARELELSGVPRSLPQQFSLAQPQRGSYHFDESRRRKPIITVRMTFVLHENTPQEKRETLVVPLRRIGDLTWVRSLVW